MADAWAVVEAVRAARFPSREALKRWMEAPNADLGGHTPRVVFAAGQHGRLILALTQKRLREHNRVERQRIRDEAAEDLAVPSYTTREVPVGDQDQDRRPNRVLQLPPSTDSRTTDAPEVGR